MDRRKSVDKVKYNKSTHEWEEENLDEEMEEIFHPAKDHFSLADLVERDDEAKPNFDENDFELHRRESLQYHQPLHKLYHKHKKSSHRSEKNVEENVQPMSTVSEEPVVEPTSEKEEPSEDEPLLNHSTITTDSSQPQQVSDSNKDKVQFYVGSSSSLENAATSSAKKPLKSALHTSNKDRTSHEKSPPYNTPSSSKRSFEDALSSVEEESSLQKPHDESTGASSDIDREKAKVTFLLGEESEADLQKDQQRSAYSKPTYSKHTKRRSTKRKHYGFNIDKKYENVLEPEEAETLQTADIDDMASHRFEDAKGIRRPKISKFFSSLFSKEDSLFKFNKKKYDNQPHELLVELHELKLGDYPSEWEWRQTARWIKYEEDVELGPDRWGKPHVPPLCFHSLIKLRQFMEAGAVLLDLEESNLMDIITRIVDTMIQTDQFHPNLRDKVLRTLMQRHRHVNEKGHPPLRRNSAGYGNLSLLSHDRNRSPLFSKSTKSKPAPATHALNNGESSAPVETSVLVDSHEMNALEITPTSKRKSFSIERQRNPDPEILRRIPKNAEGVAILVGQLSELEKPASAFIRLAEGKEIPLFLEIPIKVRFIYILLGPTDTNINYHEIGRALGSLMSNEEFRINMYKTANMKDIFSAFAIFLDKSTVLPPGKWKRNSLLPLEEIRRKSSIAVQHEGKEPPKKPAYHPLKRTGRLFGGFIQDIKNRYVFYKSDLLDGINLQCIASVIFIYFAAISGAVAFGGLLAEKTQLHIGVSETLIGTALSGVLFSLLAGQPLIIIGTTGPLLLFDEMLYQLKDYYSSPFLVMRVWVGIWTAVIATVVVAAEGSVLVNFFSRFFQEIFATIISLIFIFESLSKLYKTFMENPLLPLYCDGTNGTNTTPSDGIPTYPQPNTALLSAILMIGTFYIALFLRHFRNSKFLGRSARRALGDFGVPIGIVIMGLLDFSISSTTYTQKLRVPEGLSPTTPRGWFISPLPVQVWEAFIALIGGFLIFILLFMETQICELIISKKQLQKGSGFHLDMMLIGYMEMISAFIGGPWQCAATVRSISHVSSLIVLSKTHVPGELPHVIEVKEQRLTNLLVSVLIGLSVLMAPLLRKVPLAVLFGVFLYMGISALSGIQLYERFLLIFMPAKHHPDLPFVRKVRTKKMHLYTGIQVFCIAVLWVVKTYFSPAFPFGLLSMIFVHSQIKRLFTKEEIRALDGEASEDEDKDNEDEPDFYEQIVA